MFDVIITEFIKLNRSKVLWLIPIAVILPVLMALGFLSQQTSLPHYWGILLNAALVYMSYTTPAILAVITGFVFSREYQENTINTIFTYPIPRRVFYLAKLSLLVLVNLIITISFAILLTMAGFAFKYEMLLQDTFPVLIKSSLLLALTYCSLTPLAALVGIAGKKSIIPASTLGILLVFSNIFLTRPDYSVYIPGCIPALIASNSTSALHGFMRFGGDIDKAAITLIVTFVLSTAAGMIYYQNADVA